jgi:hypothetical protein
MRKIIFVAIITFLSNHMFAQIVNTSWKGFFQVPDSMELVLQFKTDTLMVNTPDSETVEMMQYKVQNDTLSLVKITGQSDCMDNSTALCKFEIKADTLFITTLKDDCSQRASAWPLGGLVRMK